MLVPFESLPDHSRIWIYPSNRLLTDKDKTVLEKGLNELCNQWEAHGNALTASWFIECDRFIILAVDEQTAGASGCSIDGSVRLLKNIQERLGLDLFNRAEVAILVNGIVQVYPLVELKTLFDNRTLTGESLTFNNGVATKKEWETKRLVPVKDVWLSRYLPKVTVAQ